MADPSSFMVGNAPGGANYAAPLVNFAPLSQLPDQFAQGQQQQFQRQQNARTTALQNAFPDGVPTDPQTGRIDIPTTTSTLAKLGGADYVQQLMPFIMQGNMGHQGADAIASTQADGSPPSPSAPTSRPNGNAAGPANLRPSGPPPPQQPQSPGQPQTPQPGQPGQISMAGQGSQQNPYQPKSQADFNEIPNGAYWVGPGGTPQLKGRGPSLTATAQNGSAATGAPVSGVSGGPAPMVGNAPETAAPSTGIVPNGAPAGPNGSNITGQADALNRRAAALRQTAAGMAAYPSGAAEAKVLQEQAQAYDAQATQIREFQQQNTAPTQPQKDLASGTTQKGEIIKADVARSQKVYSGISGAASQYEGDAKTFLDLSKSILNDPSMYTGTGANLALNYNRIASIYGDKAPAMLQEAFSKVTATNVLSQLNTQKDQMMEAGQNTGRIFAQQVELVNKAAPQLENTLAGNRFLVEVQSRMGEQASEIARQARAYMADPKGPGYLDSKFDSQMASYLKAHPIFTTQEFAHTQLLGAPTVPTGLKGTQILDWANKMGLKPGDAMRRSDGQSYATVPGAAS